MIAGLDGADTMKTRGILRGFTLIELMTVVAILAVLSTVAVFSYKAYMRKARTQEAIAFLMDIKMKQDTYFMTYSRYVDTGANAEDYYPTMLSSPTEWLPGSSTWDCDNPPNQAILGFCALGIRPTTQYTWFQYVTMGWAPGDAAPPDAADGPIIRDPTRRWWFARAKGYAGSDGYSLPFELRLTSEVSEVMQIGP
jgi:prepilin-type N-terminal cleavage/methylation domain-containing protein